MKWNEKFLRGGASVARLAHNQKVAGSIPAPVTKCGGRRGATVPTSQPVFLDVQGPLLRSAGLEFELQRTRDWLGVAIVAAVCGWLVVAVILCLI